MEQYDRNHRGSRAPRRTRAAIAACVLAGLQACGGTLGGTKSFTLDLRQPASQPRYAVHVASVGAALDSNEVDSIGTFHLGKLDDGELGDIRKSLVSSLQQVKWPKPEDAAGTLELHLLVTHYYVAHSNNDGAIIAAIDWALSDDAKQVVFSERFFASVEGDDIKGLNTLGKVKNLLNRQIVRRVVESGIQVASEPGRPPGVAVEYTFSTAGEAAARLPERLTSVFGLPQFSTKGMDWTRGMPTAPVDWSRQLAGRR